jgi:hypothetical protein
VDEPPRLALMSFLRSRARQFPWSLAKDEPECHGETPPCETDPIVTGKPLPRRDIDAF